MRAPRYRFPDHVRETTREIAARMVEERTIAYSAAEFDTWVSERPEIQSRLEAGGYGQQFSPADLFPLLQVFIAQAGGPAVPNPAASATASSRSGLKPTAVLLVAFAVLLAVALALLL